MASETLERHWRQVIGIIAKRDGRFIEIERNSKLPTRKGWNQTANTLTKEQALEHLAAGKNIGHATGTGDVYVFDFDDNAERGHESDHLGGGLYTYRDNAPQKAKFLFTCPDPIPTRLKSKTHGLDLLGINANGTHANAVIAGMHDSGVPILWGGSNVPELSSETVAAIWKEWTDADLFATEREEREPDATYATVDLARVADALKYVDPNEMDYTAWVGIIAAIHDAFGDDARDMVIDWADGKPGEVAAKWKTFFREYTGAPATLDRVFYLARKGGWPDTWLQDQLKQHGRWLASPDAIDELKAAGFKNPERARKLLDTILEKCEGKKTLRIKPGYACLSKESGISKGGIGGYLARLFTGGFINLHTGEEGEPTGIELVLRNLNTSSLLVDGGGVQVAQNWILYREFRADEVFINGHAAYTATHPNATLAPLGDNGLSALLPLQDGPLTIAEAAEETGHSYGAMARTLRRYAEHGMVDVTVGERNRKTYTLKAEWRDILKINIPKMTTFGVMLFRNVAALGSRVKYLRAKGADDKADAVEKEHARLDALERKVKETAGIIPFVQPDRIDKPQPFKKRAPNVTLPPHVLQRRTDASRPTEADKWRRREYAKDIAAAGYDWAELNAWATLEHGAGWWTHKDKTAIIGQYRIFQIVANQTPTVHWAGEHLVAA